jgi:hypothetical protein
MRIDGSGHDEGLCVRTTKRRFVQVFTADEVEPGSVALTLWYVIDRRQPRFKPSDAPCRLPSSAQ